MPSRVLLVDYENVTRVDLARIPDDAVVLMFSGGQQKTVPRDIYRAARKLGDRCIDIEMLGQGKDALDFLIAYYLGEYLTRTPSLDCVVLSKDKGFDPLVAHLRSRGFKIRRANDQTQALAATTKAAAPVAKKTTAVAPKATAKPAPKARAETLPERVRRMWDLLRKADSKARPRKRKALLAHVGNHFKGTAASDIEQIVDKMFADGWIRESGGKLEYSS